MKWEEKVYAIGEKRIVNRFLFTPKYILAKTDEFGGHIYIHKWLEKAKWEEQYEGDGYWRDVRWIDD